MRQNVKVEKGTRLLFPDDFGGVKIDGPFTIKDFTVVLLNAPLREE